MLSLNIIGHIIVSVINLFLLVLVVRVILSWLTLPPSKPLLYLYKVTDPVINLSKQYFPIKIGILDLSIIFPFLFLNIISKFASDILIMGRSLTLFYLLGLLFFSIDSILNIVVIASILLCVMVIFFSLIVKNSYNPIVTSLKPVLLPILVRLDRILRFRSKYKEFIYLTILIILIIIVGHFAHKLLLLLVNFSNQLDLESFKRMEIKP